MSALSEKNNSELPKETSDVTTTPTRSSDKKLTKQQIILNKITSIDDFIRLCDTRGCFMGMEPKESDHRITIDSPYTTQDARDIRDLFEITYRGTYPYLEMLDLEYLINTFFEDKFEWIVFRLDDENSPDRGKIIGSWLWVIDYDQRSAYNRGFNLLPKYHGKLPLLNLTYRAYRPLMIKLKGKIDKWYNESRTAHAKSQFLSHGGGAHTDALFMNKDYFMGKKESDVMMVAFYEDGMKARRKPETLLPEVAPFYVHASKNHGLEVESTVEMGTITPKIDPVQVHRVLSGAELLMDCDQYGYIRFTLSDPMTGSTIKGLHTTTVQNIEKLKVECEDPSVLMGLWYRLKQYAKSQKIEYMECILPASALTSQKVLLSMGMAVEGYVPCWMLCEGLQKYEDAVVLGWSQQPVDEGSMRLTPEGRGLLKKLDREVIAPEGSKSAHYGKSKAPNFVMHPKRLHEWITSA